MDIDYLSLCIFALVTTFTPGPNTVSSAMLAMQVGYRRSIPYFLGIASGFFLIMLFSGMFSSVLDGVLGSVMHLFSYLGAAYILFLAFRVLQADFTLSEEHSRVLGYRDGLLLQILNPKVLVLALTLYTTFLLDIHKSGGALVLSALFFTLMSFSAISLWAFFGSTFSHFLRTKRIRHVVNGSLALLLLYSAISLVVQK
ncbi:MAG: LysE family translocator [Sphaerochaeta sp.]